METIKNNLKSENNEPSAENLQAMIGLQKANLAFIETKLREAHVEDNQKRIASFEVLKKQAESRIAELEQKIQEKSNVEEDYKKAA